MASRGRGRPRVEAPTGVFAWGGGSLVLASQSGRKLKHIPSPDSPTREIVCTSILPPAAWCSRSSRRGFFLRSHWSPGQGRRDGIFQIPPLASMDVRALDASFRDPSGFVYRRDGTLYRQVNRVFGEQFEAFMASSLYDELVRARLLIPPTVESLDLAAIGAGAAPPSRDRAQSTARADRRVPCSVGPKGDCGVCARRMTRRFNDCCGSGRISFRAILVKASRRHSAVTSQSG